MALYYTTYEYFLMKKFFVLSIFLLLSDNASSDTRFTIEDYYRHLPKKYQDFYADIAFEPRVNIDIPNGYLSITAQGQEGPLFEMGLFRNQQGEAFLIISNLQSDCACQFYKSFFLQYKQEKWQSVNVLPKLIHHL